MYEYLMNSSHPYLMDCEGDAPIMERALCPELLVRVSALRCLPWLRRIRMAQIPIQD